MMSRLVHVVGFLAFGVAVAACSTASLERTRLAEQMPETARAFTARAGAAPTTVERPAKPAAAPVPSPPEAHPADRSLTPADVAFVGELDEGLWRKAAVSSWRPKGASLSEETARVVMLARSPHVRAAWSTFVARTQRHSQALFLRRLIEEIDGFVRKPEDRPGEWPLPAPDASSGRVVERDVALAEQQFRIRVWDLLVRLTEVFHGARYEARSVSVLQKHLKLSDRLVAVVNSRYESGKASQANLLRAQMRASETRQALRSAVERTAAFHVRLASLLDLPGSVRPGSPTQHGTRPSLRTVLAAAASAPDLRAAELLSQRAQATLELMERRVLPLLTSGLSERGGNPAGPSFPAAYITGAPFLDELRARTAARGSDLQQARTAALATAEAAWSRLGGTERLRRLYAMTHVPKATRALEATEADYRVGRTDFLDLDDLQRLWLKVSLTSASVRRDVHVARARLERALGRPLAALRKQRASKP